MTTYYFKLKFTEPVLGMAPSDPEVYKRFIATQSPQPEATTPEEIATLAKDKELAGYDIFHRDDLGLFLYDYHIRGFLKAAAEAVTGKALTAYKSKIDKWLFVMPRRLYFFGPDNQIVKQADGFLERPLRAMTMQGPRVSLKRSDKLEPGCTIAGKLNVMPLGEKELTGDLIKSWFEYGALQGIGEWRSGSYGRFELVEFKPGPSE